MDDPFGNPDNADLFNVTIDDTSPTIQYSPFADGFGNPEWSILATWNPSFPDPASPVNQPNPNNLGQTGKGTSLHTTEADRASFTITFNGELIYCNHPLRDCRPLGEMGYPVKGIQGAPAS